MITHDELRETLIAWVEAGRLRPVDIARELNLPSSRVSEILGRRRRIQQDEMPIVARMLELSGSEAGSVRKIKRIGLVPAGQLRQALDESTDTIETSADLPKDVFALEVDGESMNLLAPFGADVIVDPNDKNLFAGDLYVLGNGSGEFTFKLFKQDPARLVPLSDDPSHQVTYLGSDPIDIIGRVVTVALGAGALRNLARTIGNG